MLIFSSADRRFLFYKVTEISTNTSQSEKDTTPQPKSQHVLFLLMVLITILNTRVKMWLILSGQVRSSWTAAACVLLYLITVCHEELLLFHQYSRRDALIIVQKGPLVVYWFHSWSFPHHAEMQNFYITAKHPADEDLSIFLPTFAARFMFLNQIWR